jgi:hypothetical protein
MNWYKLSSKTMQLPTEAWKKIQTELPELQAFVDETSKNFARNNPDFLPEQHYTTWEFLNPYNHNKPHRVDVFMEYSPEEYKASASILEWKENISSWGQIYINVYHMANEDANSFDTTIYHELIHTIDFKSTQEKKEFKNKNIDQQPYKHLGIPQRLFNYYQQPGEFDARVAGFLQSFKNDIYKKVKQFHNNQDIQDYIQARIDVVLSWLKNPASSMEQGWRWYDLEPDAITTWKYNPILWKRFSQRVYHFLQDIKEEFQPTSKVAQIQLIDKDIEEQPVYYSIGHYDTIPPQETPSENLKSISYLWWYLNGSIVSEIAYSDRTHSEIFGKNTDKYYGGRAVVTPGQGSVVTIITPTIGFKQFKPIPDVILKLLKEKFGQPMKVYVYR